MRHPVLIALASIFGTVASQGACFVPNGTNREALTNVGNNKYEPCNGNGHSMCCNVATGDQCQTNGLCWNEVGRLLWRESCTDPTWQSPKCVKLCISDDDSNINDVPASGMDVVVTQCADGSYCCGNDQKASNCCKTGEGVRIVNGEVVTSSSSSPSPPSSSASATAGPTTSSSSPSIPTNLPNDNVSYTSRNQARVIGGAVGGAVGAVVLAIAAWFFWHRRRKEAAATGTVTDAMSATQNHDVVSDKAKYGPSSPAPMYHRLSELPGEARPAELESEPTRPPYRP